MIIKSYKLIMYQGNSPKLAAFLRIFLIVCACRMIISKSLTCPEQGMRACKLTIFELGFCMRNRLIYSEQLASAAAARSSKNEFKKNN